ncbi:hypothetical protein AMS62_07060 [Bacillus sp. FJAT-18019]|nr:hypothetical protein AMS62_07060 [Bacillus sp. FJAT-18019]
MLVRARMYQVLGAASGVASMLLWCILIFFNPYTGEVDGSPALITFLMLFLPGCLALIAIVYSYRALLLIAFVWSVLPSLYLAGTPGIFAWFGATSLGYLFAYLLVKTHHID